MTKSGIWTVGMVTWTKVGEALDIHLEMEALSLPLRIIFGWCKSLM